MGAGWFPTENWNSLNPQELGISIRQQKEKKTLLASTSSACHMLMEISEQMLVEMP